MNNINILLTLLFFKHRNNGAESLYVIILIETVKNILHKSNLIIYIAHLIMRLVLKKNV